VEKVFSDQGNVFLKIMEMPETVGIYEEKCGFHNDNGDFTLSKNQPESPWLYENKVYDQTMIDRTLLILRKYGTFFRPGPESIFEYQMNSGVINAAYYELFNVTDSQLEVYVQSINLRLRIDASAKTIKYDLYWAEYPYSTYDIQLTDIGNTIFAYPLLEEFKTICVNQIDAFVASLDLEYVTSGSMNAFNNLVNSYKQIINGETDIFLVAAKMNLAFDEILWFTFVYDTLALAKDTSIRSITDYFDVISTSADEATLASMANLLNTCIANINGSTTVEQVGGYETQFYTDINNLVNVG
jgi:hypothetical protein